MNVVVYGYIGIVVNFCGKCLSKNCVVFWEYEGEDVVKLIKWIVK